MPAGAVLDLCDRLLGEIGRRQHRFSWLRPPGSGIEDCLVCDAYYPGNRLVAIYREDGGEPDALYAEEIPRNGLLLLVISPSELGRDRLSASDALVEQIGALGPRPDRPRGPALAARAEPQPAAPQPLVPPAPAAPPAPPRPEPRRPEAARAAEKARQAATQRISTPEREQRFGMLIGLALALVVAAELLILVEVVSLGHDRPVLAFGFALDACARTLGTIAAGRAGDHARAWACIVFGSPAVISLVLLGPDGAIKTEPGPLAGVVSVLAIGIVVIALLGAPIGI